MTQKPPAFTFATGNAHKLLALPVYALGVVATMLIPRKRGHWVFGCGSGIGEGALALYRVASAEAEAQATGAPSHITWLARNSAEMASAASQGIPAVVKSTWRGFWLTLRAQVIVVTHGLGDANRYATRGAFILQLWHGIPLKRINLDSQRTTNSAILPNARWVQKTLAALYRLAASTISFMPAASEVSAARLRTAFGLDSERVVVTGDPRDDVLCEGTDIERTANARAALLRALAVAELPQRVLLYAPTWRDGDADPAVPSDTEWALIDRWLQSADAALIIRPHPLGLGSYAAGVTTSERVHLLDSTARSDINPVLAGVDILITDYSSIALDFALLGRPIAFLAADLDPYANSRGLYEDYSSFSGGHHVTSWPAVLELIGERDSGTPTRKVGLAELAGHATALATRYHAFRDGHNTERVYLEVTRRLGVR